MMRKSLAARQNQQVTRIPLLVHLKKMRQVRMKLRRTIVLNQATLSTYRQRAQFFTPLASASLVASLSGVVARKGKIVACAIVSMHPVSSVRAKTATATATKKQLENVPCFG